MRVRLSEDSFQLLPKGALSPPHFKRSAAENNVLLWVDAVVVFYRNAAVIELPPAPSRRSFCCDLRKWTGVSPTAARNARVNADSDL